MYVHARALSWLSVIKTIKTKKKKTSYDAHEKVLKKLDFLFSKMISITICKVF